MRLMGGEIRYIKLISLGIFLHVVSTVFVRVESEG